MITHSSSGLNIDGLFIADKYVAYFMPDSYSLPDGCTRIYDPDRKLHCLLTDDRQIGCEYPWPLGDLLSNKDLVKSRYAEAKAMVDSHEAAIESERLRDQKIEAERVAAQAYAALSVQGKRALDYPPVGDQLDAVMKFVDANRENLIVPDSVIKWINDCKAVKDKFPKAD